MKNLPGRSKLEYQVFKCSDTANPPSEYQFYFYTGQNILIAVIYRLPKEPTPSVVISKSIEASLQSLSVGPEAEQRRQRYRPPKTK